MSRLIALVGKAGSGKNTVARLIPGAVEFAFADPMKDFCRDVFGFSDEQVRGSSEARSQPDPRYPREHGPFSLAGVCACCGWRCVVDGRVVLAGSELEPTCYLTPRFALQTLGTEWGRECHPDVWARYGVRRALATLSCPQNGPRAAVITDCRFVNEARVVREAGGQVWRIVRPGAGLAGAAGQHPSEVEQDSPEMEALVTHTIRNDGTLEDLAAVVLRLVDWPDSL